MANGKRFIKIKLGIAVSRRDWLLMKRGSLPQSMEQKWVIFYRDGVLNFHRSRHTIFKITPEVDGDKLVLQTLYCRRGIPHFYNPPSRDDEKTLVLKMIQLRLKTPADEPWFGWDPRYNRSDGILFPDFSDFESM